MSTQSRANVTRKVEAVRKWAETPEAVAELNNLAERVASIGQNIIKDNQVDQNSLRKPVTF